MIREGNVEGEMVLEGRRFNLQDFQGVFLRLMDQNMLPEVEGESANSSTRLHADAIHAHLVLWTEIGNGRFVNRPRAMASNLSKPYQAQIIQEVGLRVPETLITNDPEEVRKFHAKKKNIIYKSMSGVRSIVQCLESGEVDRLENIRWCATQFQECIKGQNVRVHVVGRKAFATAIQSDATDYRYATRQGHSPAQLSSIQLPAETEAKCVNLASRLGLALAGIDLMVEPNGATYCFEVNPCPAFNYYEEETGAPISQAIAQHLVGQD